MHTPRALLRSTLLRSTLRHDGPALGTLEPDTLLQMQTEPDNRTGGRAAKNARCATLALAMALCLLWGGLLSGCEDEYFDSDADQGQQAWVADPSGQGSGDDDGSAAGSPTEGQPSGQTSGQTSTGSQGASQPASSQLTGHSAQTVEDAQAGALTFRSYSKLDSHFEKHGIDMGFGSPEEYLAAANAVVANPAALHKLEAEDGDDVFFLADTGEIVFVSESGYIRTYFVTDKDYFDRQ